MAARESLLVGRERELRQIVGALEALARGRGAPIFQIAGAPGIGKSRLLRALALGGRERGQLVFAGRAAEFEGELPFGVFVDALDDWLLALAPGRRALLAGELAAELSVVFAAFEALAGERQPELHEERYRSYRAVRRLLAALAIEAPVILALDDVQWADPGSIELLGHLLAHPPRGRVLVALAFRPAQLPDRLEGALAAAVREDLARRLDVTPLSKAACRKLLADEAPAGIHARLYRESGGNPFFALQLARGVAVAAAAAAPAGSTQVPESIRAALSSELSSLSAPALVLLQGAAVTGDPFDAALAARAADMSEPDMLDLLAELLQFELVHAAQAPGEFAFRHPIIRATVYETAKVGWRALAHARLAALLASRGASASAQAPHVERSGGQRDPAAVAVLVAAGDASARRTPALAARWYAAALRLLPDGTEAEDDRIGLMVALATAHSGAGDLGESRDVLHDVLGRLAADDPRRVQIVAFCAGVEHLLGRHREAQGRLERALRTIADQRAGEAVALQLELAAGAAFENRYDDQMRWAEQALDGATRLGARAMAVAALGQVALASYFLGRPVDEVLDRAAAGLDALTDEELATRLDIGLWVGWSESVLERHESAVAHCRRVIDVARATGQGATLLVTMTAQAWAELRMGRLNDAETTLGAALDTGRLAPHLFLAVAVGLSAVLATYRGDYRAAVRLGEECVRLARTADAGLIPGMSGLYMATPLIEMGDAERAREIVLEMSRGKPELETSRSGYAPAYEVLARAEVALGRVDAAENWAKRAEAAVGEGALAVESAFARRARATVALARGDASRAAQIALDAAARAADAGAPGEAGRCRILAASALARAGQHSGAIGTLELAVEQLGRIGAHGYRAQAETELRRLRRSAKAQQGVDSLTRREREVAEHVREGRTNREIASMLFLSEKTVERHLSRVFEKLGVSSRTAVAVLMAERSTGPTRTAREPV